jgi:gliding motility-associated protein GldM
MAGGKETPRQKMIGMMYLVLTALLALNVSKDILDAFVVVNDGLERTKVNFKVKSYEKYASFKKAFDDNPRKVGIYWNEALTVQTLTGDMIAYIDKLKAELISKTEKKLAEEVISVNEIGQDTVLSLKFVNAKDNFDIPTHILIGDKPEAPSDKNEFTARQLRYQLEDFKNQLSNVILTQPNVDSTNIIYKSIQKSFDFSDGKDASGVVNNWESLNFYHTPLAATITILSKIQTDVLNAESDVVSYLHNQVDASSFKFTELSSVVIPKSSYVFTGDTFRADVFLAAFDPTQDPVVYLSQNSVASNDSTPLRKSDAIMVDVDNSRGHIKIPARATGDYRYKGIIEFKGPDGLPRPYSYDIQYEVALPALTVAPTKMNVFYKGVENPVEISAPGVSADDLRPSISNGTISRKGKSWIVKVRQGNKAVITVRAQMPDGTIKVMGKKDFRVKTVPDPVPSFAGKRPTDNRAKKTELTAARGVIAKLDDFDFDMKFTITQFKVVMIINGTPVDKVVRGNKINSDITKMLKKARKGQMVLIESIKAKGEDGSIRNLPPISLKVSTN